MNVVLFGATGMVGAGTLLECFADPRVTSVLAVTRSPTGITAGPDGNLWFNQTNESGSIVARVTTAGVFTLFTPPSTTILINGITAGADGNLWFTGFSTIARIRPQ